MPPRHRHDLRDRDTRRVVVVVTVVAVAACALGFGIGAHAAIGDNDGPAVLLAHPGILPDDLGVEAGGTAGDGGTAGGGRAGDADPGSPGPRSPGAPHGSTPNPTPPSGTPPASPSPSRPPVGHDATDPMSAAYNPYTTPGDPAFVTDAAKSAWLGEQAVIRQCMADAGLAYLEWQWWFGGSPMPPGLDGPSASAWMSALRGERLDDPTATWDRAGCEGVARHAAEEAAAAGTPLSAPLLSTPDGPTPRERWLEFQDAVRACMSAVGFAYRYWEFWNPAYTSDGGPPAMPTGLDDAQRAAWNAAAFGTDGTDASSGTGGSGGCWAQGAAATSYVEFE